MPTLETDTHESAEVLALPLRPVQAEQGVFDGSGGNGSLGLLPLPSYSSEIDLTYRKPLNNGSRPYGTWWLEEWRTTDGIRFQVARTEPRRWRTDVKYAKGTPWTTQAGGVNLCAGLGYTKQGMGGVVIGPEIDASIPLSHSAYLVNKILEVLDREGFGSADEAVFEGFSRPAMFGFGVEAYAKQVFGRNMIYVDLTDPCLYRSVQSMSAREKIAYLKYLPIEGVCMARQLGRMVKDPVKRRHYPKTVDLSWEGAKQVVQTGRPLMNGEAGFLANHVSQDAKMRVGFLLKSLPNQKEEYKAALAGRPGVVTAEDEGAHTSGIRDDILEGVQRLMSGLILQLSLGARPDEIDYTLVHLPEAA